MKILRVIVVLALFFSAGPAFAQRAITIKMSSPVPENTPWGQFLNQIAGDWRRITNGQVDVIIFHNGTAGTEEAVVRNLRLNQLQAAVLSTFGLTEVAPEVMTLSSPFFIRNDDELDLVLRETKAELEEKINAKGFYTLAWSRVGWVKIFSKTPVFEPADLKKQKLGTNSEYDKLNQAFKAMGFQMVPVAQGEILIALNSPMVDAVYSSPVAVGGTQLFALAKNMASINVAPFMGAIILNRRTWNSIPDRFKPQLIEAARKRELELDQTVRKFEDDMIKTMGSYGLKVNQLTSAQEQLWYDEIGRAMPGLVGTLFDRGIYGRIETILRDYRSKNR
ncbi:MAG: TRAP transporter substrate-binding protein DctP [Treponema sp.]|nr:TRAP transporter substrate-binding protein DctP [Treponema sp.]